MDFEIKENTNVIIVTGVAVFIGFSLTLCLLKQGVTVIGIDSLTGEKTKCFARSTFKYVDEIRFICFLKT